MTTPIFQEVPTLGSQHDDFRLNGGLHATAERLSLLVLKLWNGPPQNLCGKHSQ